MNIVSDRDSFVWKGHDKLTAKQSVSYRHPGYRAASILQLHPPAAVTAMHCHAEWSIVAAGTAHGLAIYDMVVPHCLHFARPCFIVSHLSARNPIKRLRRAAP